MYADKNNIECIILVLCQNTLATCVSLFEPVNALYPKPKPINNIINLKYLEYLLYFEIL